MKSKREAKLAAQVKKLRREKKDLEEQNTFLIQANILAEERYAMLGRVSQRWKELARRRGGEALERRGEALRAWLAAAITRDPRTIRFIANSILESRIRYSGMENDAEDD